jgi:O-antigen/teichoic acid export membrane protein
MIGLSLNNMAIITNNIKRYIRNFSWLVLAESAIKGASFVVVILIARELGQEQLGIYSSLMSLVFIFAVVADFGMSSIITRNLARDKKDLASYLSNGFGVKIILGILASLLVLFTGWMLGKTGELLVFLAMASFWMITDSLTLLFAAVFKAFENMHLIAIVNFVSKLFLIAGIGVLALGGWEFSLKGVFLVYIFSGLLGLFGAAYIASKRYGKFKLSFNPLFSKGLLKESYFLGLSALCFAVYNRVDVLMLSTMQSDEAAGIYSACYALFILAGLLPTLAVSAVFPSFSRDYITVRRKLHWNYIKGMKILLLFAIAIVTGTYIIGEWLLGFLYGSGYAEAVPALRILMLSIVFTFPASLISGLLVISGHQKWVFWSSVMMVLVNVVLNLILIPAHSYMGASIAMLATGAFNLAILYVIVRKSIKWDEKAIV